VLGLALSGDGQFLVTAGPDRRDVRQDDPTGHHRPVRVWHVDSGVELFGLSQHQTTVTCVALSADGRLLATGGRDRGVKLWDLDGRRLLHTFTGHPGDIVGVALSPDKRTLIAASRGAVKVWDVEGRRRRPGRGFATRAVTALALGQDGRTLVLGEPGLIRVWDLETGTARLTVRFRSPRGPRGLALSADGKTLAFAAPEGLGVIDLGARRVRPLQQPSGPALSAAFTPDGKSVAAGCADGTVKVYDVASGHLRAVLSGHTRGVTALAFSGDGRTLVSASGNPERRTWWSPGGEVKVWRSVAPLAELARTGR
jgi:WD40 repeat protein